MLNSVKTASKPIEDLINRHQPPKAASKADEIENANGMTLRDAVDKVNLKGDNGLPALPTDGERRYHPLYTSGSSGQSAGTGAQAQDVFSASAESFGLLASFKEFVAENFGGRIEDAFASLGSIRNSAVHPRAIANLFSHSDITDFRTMRDIADQLRDLFQPERNSDQRPVSDDVSSFLSDPNLSLEAKLMLLMAKLSKELDEEIEDKMNKLAKATGKTDESAGTGGTNATAGTEKPDKQRLQTELQDLVHQRQQMFTTMNGMLKSLHDTSMSAIRNIN